MPGSPHRQPSDPSGSRVLVVGADALVRRRMLDELRSVLPAGTAFLEAAETWETLARAADSSMVVLADDLGELSAQALLRLLARRNPSLPILAVGADHRARRLSERPLPDEGQGAARAVDAARV